MIGFPLVIAVSDWDMPGIEHGPLSWHTSALTNELQEVNYEVPGTPVCNLTDYRLDYTFREHMVLVVSFRTKDWSSPPQRYKTPLRNIWNEVQKMHEYTR